MRGIVTWGAVLIVGLSLYMAMAPSVQAAARHEIDLDVGIVVGASYSEDDDETWEEKGEFSENTYGLGYTFYFNPIRDEEMPNDLKVFLQHPSRIFGSISGGSFEGDRETEFDSGDPDVDTLLENNYWRYRLGGVHYFPSNTGLGIAATMGTAEREFEEETDGVETIAIDADEDQETVELWVDQYINTIHRLRFAFTNGLRQLSYENNAGSDREDDYKSQWYAFSYTAAYGSGVRFLLDLGGAYGQLTYDYDSGEDDEWERYNLNLSFGPAFARSAVFFHFDYTVWDPEDKEISFERYDFEYGVNPRFWIGDHVGLSFDLYGTVGYREYPDAVERDTLTDAAFGVDLALKVRF